MLNYQTYRRWMDRTMVFLCGAAAVLAAIPLFFLLYYVFRSGLGDPVFWPLFTVFQFFLDLFLFSKFHFSIDKSLIQWVIGLLVAILLLLMLGYSTIQAFTYFSWISFWGFLVYIWHFVTCLPTPVGVSGGGMANAILGTLTLVLVASCVGLPIGIMAGVYLSEFGKKNNFAWMVRFTADVLSGVPSIVTGIVAYTLIVRPMHKFSALAGGVALGFMMIPIVTRTTEELVKMVPHSLREASWALGISRWRTILSIVIRTARNGILTGVLLSIARVSGETAPLLFTAFNNQFWPHGINEPTASLTVQVFTYAISPFKDWQDQAWTGALVLLMLVLTINAAAKLFFKNPRQLLR